MTEILITGASGMLGRYMAEALRERFAPCRVHTLGRSPGNSYQCDLTSDMPDFRGKRFDIVAHCAGTEADPTAMRLNLEGTRNLLAALSPAPPSLFIHISSFRIYGDFAGENVAETSGTRGDSDVARSKTLAERLVADWTAENGVTLTIIRPARMFGNGVSGETALLFGDAISGRYIHIRGNNARVSIVSAFDVARAAAAVCAEGGTYNAADGRNPRLIELVEAMTENAGSLKRMTHLPASWAAAIWKGFRWLPFIDRNLNPSVVTRRMESLTIDGSELCRRSGITFFDTIRVISRKDPSYPYTH